MGEGRVHPRMSDKLRAQCEHVENLHRQHVEVRFLVQEYVVDALKLLIFLLVNVI